MTAQPTDVILHAFDWPYEMICARAESIAACGYRSVLISPPMKSFKHPCGTPWWQRYQPQDYRVIDNQLGNKESLSVMIDQLGQVGVRVYADVVFNHMANESKWRNDLVYPNRRDLRAYQQDNDYYQRQQLFGNLNEPLFSEKDFVAEFGIRDWKDKWQVQNGRITGGPHDRGLPTLKDSPYVIEQQKAFLLALKALGIQGFRIDAAKHLTLNHIKQVWSEEVVQGMHIFGEIITDGGATKQEYQLFLQPYLAQTPLSAYDFPLFQTLFNALQEHGNLATLVDPYCFGEALSKERAVTFAITHDIPNNQVFRNLIMTEQQEALAYTYLLGRDGGVPLIYSDLNTSGVVNSNGQPRWLNQWNHHAMTGKIEFHNRMHGLAMHTLLAEDEFLVFAREKQGLVVMNKSSSEREFTFATKQNWVDLITGDSFSPVGDGMLTFSVAAQSSRMLCVEA
ncbi:alpha-amylase [Vibrio tritonius]|uniref:Alpha-amylase n=1 Tax=Vibrio tritonius TaxID=1435069 RepID=A0ABS7YMV9_9VIBR|nr:alpha-amylase family glycosyl hydrolase [Vibrio tritonius]MCA2017018.1 alpha-amylase [Vibrio tritonius]